MIKMEYCLSFVHYISVKKRQCMTSGKGRLESVDNPKGNSIIYNSKKTKMQTN